MIISGQGLALLIRLMDINPGMEFKQEDGYETNFEKILQPF